MTTDFHDTRKAQPPGVLQFIALPWGGNRRLIPEEHCRSCCDAAERLFDSASSAA